MKQAIGAYCTTIIILFFSHSVEAFFNDTVDFSQMDNEIYLQPWPSYQKLTGMQTAVKSYDESQKIWWLVRKAQTENLIYFYDDFNQTVMQAMNAVTERTPLVIKIRLNVFQALIHRRQGNNALAENVLAKALTQAEKLASNYLYVYIKQDLAYTRALTALFETSLVDIQEAYVEAFSLKDQFLLALINETYGAIYNNLHDYEKSIEYYHRALEAYEYLEYPAHTADTIFGLASTYRDWKRYDLAIEYFQRYQQSIDYTPNVNISFFSLYGLAMTYAEKGDCELAITTINQALKFEGVADYNAELYKKKASCLVTLEQLDRAEEAILNATRELSKISGSLGTAEQLEVIKISASIARAHEKYDLAFEMLELYHRRYTELLLMNSSKRLLTVRASLETERQQVTQALELKRSQVELLELERKKIINTQQIYFNIFIVCVVLIVLVVIVVQYRSNQKMHVLTIKDPLTDLFNRRYIFNLLNKLITGSNPEKTELAVVLIDIDDFKKVNDKFGHPVGDKVICHIGDIGMQIFRQGDAFGRIGGEEFLCILPRTSIDEAQKVAKRFLTRINQAKMISGHQDTVTVSIGIAGLSTKCHDEKQLYVNADQALYQAKHLGKNQVNVF
jgi:diguanylate cyclase (GGDEF)-like protein